MVLYKTIATKDGGRQVQMSAEEEAEIRAEWAENERKQIEIELAQKKEDEELEMKRENLKKKLGLSDEEIDLLIKK